MARPKKIGLDYFPLNTTMNEQFKAIEELHGNDGFTWLIKFWQSAYKKIDGIVDLNGILGVIGAKTSRISTDKQNEIIKDCVSLGLLLEIEPGKYTSEGIQNRIKKIIGNREYDRIYTEKRLSELKISDNKPISTQIKVNEIKEKEIKIKEIKENILVPEHLLDIWPEFLEMRRKIRKPATDRAQKNIITELGKIAPNDHALQIQIIDQSITNSWQGIFPLKIPNNYNIKSNIEDRKKRHDSVLSGRPEL